jgi:hypothetical protein
MARIAELIPPGVTAESWDDAHRRVWSYLAALGVRRDFLLHRLVQRVMDRTAGHIENGDTRPPVTIASKEVEEEVAEWFRLLLEVDQGDILEISLRGRLALLLAEMPQRWHDQFLSGPPWPDAFVKAVRESYLDVLPELRAGKMDSPALKLGDIPSLADKALRGLDRVRALRSMLIWSCALALLGLLVYYSL